jgi:sarcosine oxidase subunit beta
VRQSGRHPAELPLATAAVARWAELGEELGADIEYRRQGNLRLARTSEEMPIIAAMVAEQRSFGLELEFLPDNQTVREIAPALGETVMAASYCPTDGHANPILTVQAFAAAAVRCGAEIRTETTVTAIDADGGRVRGVRTSAGDLAADAVVIAAGVYSGALLAPLGVELPLQIEQVSVVQTVPLPPLIAQVLGTVTADFAGRQEVGGRFRLTDGGSPWTYALDDLTDNDDLTMPPAGNIAAAIASAAAVLPALAEARVARVWGGLLDMTPDALPVIERTPQVDGLVVAAGFSGHGFCLGPVTGRIVRDLVLDGTTPFPIAPFRSGRFAGDSPREAATLHG